MEFIFSTNWIKRPISLPGPNTLNFFKESLAWFNLDYHPGYDIKELEEQPLVDNPDIALVRKGIKALKNDIKELQKEIDLCHHKLGTRKDRRIEKKINRLEQEKSEKEAELQRFETKLSELPGKISILELLKGRPINRCDLEKKKLYDLMQCLAFHSRERLIEIFRDCYDDPRDIKQILGMITRRSGLLKLIGDTLVVIIDGIDNKKYRKAADKLCHKLNEKEMSLVSRLKVKLSFHLNKIRNKKFVPTESA
jgi:predicted transcriptional regulator with HTH domain